jgi:hypothetical protein
VRFSADLEISPDGAKASAQAGMQSRPQQTTNNPTEKRRNAGRTPGVAKNAGMQA